MKSILKVLGMLVLSVVADTSLQAQIITLNFGTTLNLSNVYGAGAGATTGWYNGYTAPNGSNLLDTANQATTADFFLTTYNATTKSGAPAATIDGYLNLGGSNALYGGEAYFQGQGVNTLEINFQEIPYATYSVYVYADAFNGLQNAISLYEGNTQHGGTYQLAGSARPSSSYQLGTSTDSLNPSNPANYVVFTGVTGSSFALDLYGSGQFGLMSGIEIVETTAAVPEPSTWALLLSGLAGFVWLRQRRKSAIPKAAPMKLE